MEAKQQTLNLTKEQKAKLVLKKILVTNLAKIPKEEVRKIEDELQRKIEATGK
jgi:hypothetical protein